MLYTLKHAMCSLALLSAMVFVSSRIVLAQDALEADIQAQLASLPSLLDARAELAAHPRGTIEYADALNAVSKSVAAYLTFDSKYLNSSQNQFIDEVLRQISPKNKFDIFIASFSVALQGQRYEVARNLFHRAGLADPQRLLNEACSAAMQLSIDEIRKTQKASPAQSPEELNAQKRQIEFAMKYHQITGAEIGSLRGAETLSCDVQVNGRMSKVPLKKLLGNAGQAPSAQVIPDPIIRKPSKCTETQAEALLAKAIFQVTPGFGYAFQTDSGACVIGGLMRLEGSDVVFYVNRFIGYSDFAVIRGKDSEAMFSEYEKHYELIPSRGRLSYVTFPRGQFRERDSLQTK